MNDVETLLARLVEARLSMALARDILSGKTPDTGVSRQDILKALEAAIESTPAEALVRWTSAEYVCSLVREHVHPCSCCRKKGCNGGCRCSNTAEIEKALKEALNHEPSNLAAHSAQK